MDSRMTIISQLNSEIAALSDLCRQVSVSYTAGADLLTKEQEALEKANIEAAEALQAPKNLLSERITNLAEGIQFRLLRINELLSQTDFGMPSELAINSLSDVDIFLKWLLPNLFSQHSAITQLEKTGMNFSNTLQSFREAMQRYQQVYEVHYIVVQKSMKNIQQSFRFWQDMAFELNQTYTAIGKQKTKDNSSLFRIRV